LRAIADAQVFFVRACGPLALVDVLQAAVWTTKIHRDRSVYFFAPACRELIGKIAETLAWER